MSEPTTAERSTRQRLLDAAERLLLQAGYDEVSVRAINAEAGVNPAAVHYHFGSKDALLSALLEQRLAPLWQEQLDKLVRRTETGWVPHVADLVDVVLSPLAELAADPLGRLRLHLLARLVLPRRNRNWDAPWFSLSAWADLLRIARPDLTASEAKQRWALAFSLVLQLFGDPLADTSATPRAVPGIPVESLAGFLTAGLDAPRTEEP